MCKTVQSWLAMCSMIFTLGWGLGKVASCMRKVVFFSGLTLEVWAFSQHCNVAIRVEGLSRFQEIRKDHPFPVPKGSVHHLTWWELWLELLLRWGIYLSPLHGLLFWLQIIAVTPYLISSNYAILETVTVNLALIQICIWFYFCFCVSVSGTLMVQTLWYSNIATIISNALQPIFSSIHRFLVIIHQLVQRSWWRLS